MTEASGVWPTVKRLLRGYDPVRIENAVGLGTPDVNCSIGWIEQKYLPKLPKGDAILKPRHFTGQQRAWLLRRWRAGGSVWLVLRAGDVWMLFSGEWAAMNLGRATTDECLNGASRTWRTREITPGAFVEHIQRVNGSAGMVASMKRDAHADDCPWYDNMPCTCR